MVVGGALEMEELAPMTEDEGNEVGVGRIGELAPMTNGGAATGKPSEFALSGAERPNELLPFALLLETAGSSAAFGATAGVSAACLLRYF